MSGHFPNVWVVESTDLLEFDDSAFVRKLDWSSSRRVLTQGKVRPHFIVIIYISTQDPFQVSGTKYDDMVQARPPDGANDGFCHGER